MEFICFTKFTFHIGSVWSCVVYICLVCRGCYTFIYSYLYTYCMNKCNECENNNHEKCVQMLNGPSKPCPCHDSDCLSARSDGDKLAHMTEAEERELLSQLHNERMDRIAKVLGL